MKTILLTIMAAVAIFLTSCGSGTPKIMKENVTVQEEVETTASTARDGKQLCGGYTEQREPTDEEYGLFRKVTDSMAGMSFTPLTVQTQVVAGINYKFYCRFSDGSEEYSPGHCWLTIYKPLPGQGEPRVTSFEKTE